MALCCHDAFVSGRNITALWWVVEWIQVGVVVFGGQRRQANVAANPLAVWIGCAVFEPGGKFAAGCGAQFVNGAMDAGFAQFTAQCDAALPALFSAFHAAAQRADLAHQFRRDRAAAFACDFTAIERHPEMGAAGAATDTWVLILAVVDGRLNALVSGFHEDCSTKADKIPEPGGAQLYCKRTRRSMGFCAAQCPGAGFVVSVQPGQAGPGFGAAFLLFAGNVSAALVPSFWPLSRPRSVPCSGRLGGIGRATLRHSPLPA